MPLPLPLQTRRAVLKNGTSRSLIKYWPIARISNSRHAFNIELFLFFFFCFNPVTSMLNSSSFSFPILNIQTKDVVFQMNIFSQLQDGAMCSVEVKNTVWIKFIDFTLTFLYYIYFDLSIFFGFISKFLIMIEIIFSVSIYSYWRLRNLKKSRIIIHRQAQYIFKYFPLYLEAYTAWDGQKMQ